MIEIEKLTKGTELAKVLIYYNLIYDTSSLKQKIICPFHNDVNPSAIADLEDGSFFCFGCGKSGDAQTFVKLMEEKYNALNDLAAYVKYKRILKSDSVSNIKIAEGTKNRKPLKRHLYNEAYDFYKGLKTVDWKEDDELFLDEKTYMLKRGFTENVLNLCKAKPTYQRNYPIVFPMLDNGKFKGWVCRTTTKKIEAKRKYLYNEGFSRATTLVGEYGKKAYVFIVEGYMDRLKFIQFGEDNVVAILGWKMTCEQIQKLKNAGITTIISALDNDECGRKGTAFLKKHFEVIRFSYLKGVKDPGEMNEQIFKKMHAQTIKILKTEESNNGFTRQNQKRSKKVRTKQK